MLTVARALVRHEFMERARDRWVIVVSLLFALLALATALYGRGLGDESAQLTGPSLVTLIALLVPLVGLVLGHDAIVGERERNTLGLLFSMPASRYEIVAGKYLGRLSALTLAIGTGLGLAMLVSGAGQSAVLATFFFPTLLMGAAFLSLGMFISVLSSRQSVAAGIVVGVWFLFVFFYELGILGLLIATDGAIGQSTVAGMVYANPSGLFRITMLEHFVGDTSVESLGMGVSAPARWLPAVIWTSWITLPMLLGGWLLSHRKVMK